MATEEPAFVVALQEGEFEVRDYKSIDVVEG